MNSSRSTKSLALSPLPTLCPSVSFWEQSWTNSRETKQKSLAFQGEVGLNCSPFFLPLRRAVSPFGSATPPEANGPRFPGTKKIVNLVRELDPSSDVGSMRKSWRYLQYA